MSSTDTAASIGHNKPPAPTLPEDKEVQAYLTGAHKAAIIDRFEELKKAAATFPGKIRDEDASGQVGDLVAQFRALFKATEAARTTENAPYRRLVAIVDGFFTTVRDKCEVLAKDLKARNEAFLLELEATRRAAAEKEAREAQARADKALKEAAEAEAKRKIAEAARIAEEQRAERARLQAEEENRIAAQAILDREAAVRAGDVARAETARLEEEAARRREDAHRDVEDKHQGKADKAAVVEARHETKVDATMGAAIAHDRVRGKATRVSRSKASDLTRVRGELGSVTSLKTVWVCSEFDKATVDLEVLRPFLSADDIQSAIGRYIAGGGRKLKGAIITEGRDAVGHRG